LPAAELPDGAMIFQNDAPHLIVQGLVRPWSMDGYGDPMAPEIGAQLITPPSTLMALRAGYRPCLHPSAYGG
jgi:hypothetical protein